MLVSRKQCRHCPTPSDLEWLGLSEDDRGWYEEECDEHECQESNDGDHDLDPNNISTKYSGFILYTRCRFCGTKGDTSVDLTAEYILWEGSLR